MFGLRGKEWEYKKPHNKRSRVRPVSPLLHKLLVGENASLAAEANEMRLVADMVVNFFNHTDRGYHTFVVAAGTVEDDGIAALGNRQADCPCTAGRGSTQQM
jgi:hypothetical protein